jgi:hypothetical protein
MSNVKVIKDEPFFVPIKMEVTIDTEELYNHLVAMGAYSLTPEDPVTDEKDFQFGSRMLVDQLFKNICVGLIQR